RDGEGRGPIPDAGAQAPGVSMDTLETKTTLAGRVMLPFPRLADPEGVAAKASGVANPAGYASRVTFVIGKDGKVTKVIEGRDAIDPAATVDACRPAAAAP